MKPLGEVARLQMANRTKIATTLRTFSTIALVPPLVPKLTSGVVLMLKTAEAATVVMVTAVTETVAVMRPILMAMASAMRTTCAQTPQQERPSI